MCVYDLNRNKIAELYIYVPSTFQTSDVIELLSPKLEKW